MQILMKIWAVALGSLALSLTLLIAADQLQANFTTDWRFNLAWPVFSTILFSACAVCLVLVLWGSYGAKRLAYAPLVASCATLGAAYWLSHRQFNLHWLAPPQIAALALFLAVAWWVATGPPDAMVPEGGQGQERLLFWTAVLLFSVEIGLVAWAYPQVRVPDYNEEWHFAPWLPDLLGLNAFLLALLLSWDRFIETIPEEPTGKLPFLRAVATKEWRRQRVK